MTKDVITIDLRKSIFDAAILMSEKMIGCLVVMDGEVPFGIITERDFVRRVVAKKLSLDTKISEITSKPLITIDPNFTLREAAGVMVENKIRRLPITEGDKLVGIIVVSDFARQLTKKTLTEQYLEAMARHRRHHQSHHRKMF